jgi:hypothetical protein
MSYLVARRSYTDSLGIDPVSGGVATPIVFNVGAPPAPKPAVQTAESWWKKLLGAGASVVTDYGAAHRASAEAQLLAQQQAAAMGSGSNLTPMLLVGGAAVAAVLLLRKK